MAERPDYPARFDDPDPNSFLAFMAASEELLDQDPGVDLWMPPITITHHDPIEFAKWAGRVNPLLEAFDREYREAALDELRRRGVDAASSAADIDSLVSTIVRGYRAQGRLMDQMRQPVPDRASHFNRNARLVAGVVDLIPGRTANARHEAAAAFLNRGITKASNSTQELTRFHIRRAAQRYSVDLLRHVNDRVLRSNVDIQTYLTAEITGLRLTVAGLCEVYRSARQAKKFPGLNGRDLALALHSHHDMPDVMDRALGVLERRHTEAA